MYSYLDFFVISHQKGFIFGCCCYPLLFIWVFGRANPAQLMCPPTPTPTPVPAASAAVSSEMVVRLGVRCGGHAAGCSCSLTHPKRAALSDHLASTASTYRNDNDKDDNNVLLRHQCASIECLLSKVSLKVCVCVSLRGGLRGECELALAPISISAQRLCGDLLKHLKGGGEGKAH